MFPVASSLYYRVPGTGGGIDGLPPYDVAAASLHKMAAPMTLAVGRLLVDCRTPPAQAASTPASPDNVERAETWTTQQTDAHSPADDMASSPPLSAATSRVTSRVTSPPHPDDVTKPTLKFGVSAILSPNFASRARTSTTLIIISNPHTLSSLTGV